MLGLSQEKNKHSLNSQIGGGGGTPHHIQAGKAAEQRHGSMRQWSEVGIPRAGGGEEGGTGMGKLELESKQGSDTEELKCQPRSSALPFKWRTIKGSEDHGQFAFCPVTISRIDGARETGGQDSDKEETAVRYF